MVSSLPLKSTNSLGPILVQFGCLPTTSELNHCTVSSSLQLLSSLHLPALVLTLFRFISGWKAFCPLSAILLFLSEIITQNMLVYGTSGPWGYFVLFYVWFSFKLITILIIFQFIFSIYFNFISMLTELNWIEVFFTLINVFVHFDVYFKKCKLNLLCK